MGWSGGSEIFEDIWSVVRDHIPDSKRVEVCKEIIITLQQKDWDCEGDFLDNEEWTEFNEAYRLAEEYWDNEC